MNIQTSTSHKKPLYEKIKGFHFYGLLLGLLVLPTPSFATYFAGPTEVLSALQFNSKGEVVFESEVFSQDHLIPIDPTAGELTPSEPNVFREESPYGESKPGVLEEESLYGEAKPDDAEVDPYSDEAIEGDDPFGDDAGSESDLEEEDPFADEEKEIANMPDPFERWYNRPVYVFNDHFYEYFMRPVAQTYKDVIAEGFRIMIRNLYQTVTFPGRLVSSLLQWKFDKAGRVISRVLINCTLGFLCTVDVANEGFGIKPVDEDFGQVLGFYGIPSGPYLVLPLLGPSSLRDGFGRAVDAVMNPLFWLVPDFATGAGVTAEQMVNETSFFIEDIKALKESAVDPYESLRDFYNQRREIVIDE
jgi:phospholipid-binding lipoprotein MlaA